MESGTHVRPEVRTALQVVRLWLCFCFRFCQHPCLPRTPIALWCACSQDQEQVIAVLSEPNCKLLPESMMLVDESGQPVWADQTAMDTLVSAGGGTFHTLNQIRKLHAGQRQFEHLWSLAEAIKAEIDRKVQVSDEDRTRLLGFLCRCAHGVNCFPRGIWFHTSSGASSQRGAQPLSRQRRRNERGSLRPGCAGYRSAWH